VCTTESSFFIGWDKGLFNFLPRLASNHNFLITASWVGRITGVCHWARQYVLLIILCNICSFTWIQLQIGFPFILNTLNPVAACILTLSSREYSHYDALIILCHHKALCHCKCHSWLIGNSMHYSLNFSLKYQKSSILKSIKDIKFSFLYQSFC
jgi:hypothetical protein